MTGITAQLVKELREKSGAGMMDCKKALNESGADIEAAVDWLRKKGLSAAAKKSGRVAAEGLVAVTAENNSGAVVEVNSETDFVSRNPDFQAMVSSVASIALKSSSESAEDLLNQKYNDSENVQAAISSLVGVIGENMNLRRVSTLKVNNGVVASYMHSAVAPNLGKIGVLVALESKADASKLQELGKKIAMHIAAASPAALKIEDVSAETIDREKDVLVAQAKASGRPDEVIEKMIEGRIRKFYEEIVLLEQAFVMDGKTRIKDVIANASKELGESVELSAYAKFTLGEGVEKKESDFAAEVKAASMG